MKTSSITKRLVGIVAGAGLAIGVTAAATPAEAAGSVWDQVAACESSGNWSINTGNGYYGGLQFSSSTWRGYGGGAYASYAHQASKGEQIAIARRVLASQGPGAWPVCSKRAGLTKSNGGADKNATPSGNPGSSSSAAKSTTKKSSAKATSGKTVKVKSGDTLAKIAARYHVKGGWRGLWKLNKATVKNPHRINVGQVLHVR